MVLLNFRIPEGKKVISHSPASRRMIRRWRRPGRRRGSSRAGWTAAGSRAVGWVMTWHLVECGKEESIEFARWSRRRIPPPPPPPTQPPPDCCSTSRTERDGLGFWAWERLVSVHLHKALTHLNCHFIYIYIGKKIFFLFFWKVYWEKDYYTFIFQNWYVIIKSNNNTTKKGYRYRNVWGRRES